MWINNDPYRSTVDNAGTSTYLGPTDLLITVGPRAYCQGRYLFIRYQLPVVVSIYRRSAMYQSTLYTRAGYRPCINRVQSSESQYRKFKEKCTCHRSSVLKHPRTMVQPKNKEHTLRSIIIGAHNDHMKAGQIWLVQNHLRTGLGRPTFYVKIYKTLPSRIFLVCRAYLVPVPCKKFYLVWYQV